jgi:hypothetical protein
LEGLLLLDAGHSFGKLVEGKCRKMQVFLRVVDPRRIGFLIGQVLAHRPEIIRPI